VWPHTSKAPPWTGGTVHKENKRKVKERKGKKTIEKK
jgi:hypothetical protein